MRKEKSFPSIIGLLLLIGCVVGGGYLITKKTFLSTQASGSCQPDNLQITNLTHKSAVISFITSSSCLSSVNIDNRTYSNSINVSSAKVHYFDISDLQAQNKYFFKIIIGGKTYSSEQYTFSTAATPNTPIPSSNLAWGKVYTSQHTPASNVIVYVNIPGASPLSAPTTSEGTWNVSLANSFNEQQTGWFSNPTDPTDEDLVVIDDSGSVTQIVNNTSRNNPVPDIIIGQNSLENNLPILPDIGSFNVGLGQTSNNLQNLSVTNPKEGDVVTTSLPDIFGIAPANTAITVNLNSQSGQTVSNSQGSWHYSPPANLANGKQILTVRILNQSTNTWTTVTRNFSVMAALGGPAFTSTPSATITLTPTTIPTSTPKPRSSVINPTITPPVTGNALPTTMILFSAIIFIFVSYILLIR